MHAHPDDKVGHAVDAWLERFNAALAAPDAKKLGALFEADGHWRDLLGLTWRFATLSGRELFAPALAQALAERGARDFAIDPRRCPPRVVERAGTPCVEAFLAFETNVGRGEGLLRMRRDGKPGTAPRAWTLFTALDELRGHEEETLRAQREEPVIQRDFHGPNWLDRRRAALDYAERDPTVLIVGGGHAGLTLAARLGQLGIDALIVDRMQRIGDNWRKRYRALKLHNQVHSNHLPYLPFPPTFPAYLSKDQIANWLEVYAECMDIAFWTQTAFEGATFDAGAGRWSARVKRADGTTRALQPKHIVMATSVSGTPNLPQIPTLEQFKGTVLHSSQFGDGAAWRGKPVLVLGTGTSAHDIAQDLHGYGARVTMVQRSPTLVVNVEPSAQVYDGVYLGEGPALEDRDLINASMPLPVTKVAHRILTERAKAYDRPLLEGLEKAGFRLSFGDEGTGWPLLYRTRGGGYYFNVGCSELIASGEVGIVQYHDIETFLADGARMMDGRRLKAELIVLATGYKGQDHLVATLFGEDVARRVGPIWGFDEGSQELRNMWCRTGQPNLWFTAGAFSQCRIYSKYLARQIKASELGLL
ncbi:MAG: NAD(P)/FAD-dependent oxidoreductase [Betaproteobacteria bacterium]|nr:NAD(P)/FAD-dependent oxidoreductase [Betaproteobacteria bacterium]